YTYANINYDLLGKIIESVTGETYNEYLTKNILKPLGMYNTSADESTAKENGLIQGYRNYFGVNLPSAAEFPDEDSWATESAGYITSSAADMGKYLQMFLRGGYGVVSEKGISTMLYNRVPTEKSGKYQYGMGWLYTDEYVEPVFNHSGRAQNYMSSMYLLPESDMGIVILADTNDYLVTNDLMDQISNKVMLTLLGHAAKELDPYAYEDSHMIINLIYIALVLVGIVEIIRARKWKRNTEGNMIINIFLHLLLPTAILLLPVIIGVPYWVIWEYAQDSFIVLTLSAFLLYIGGLMKLKK
ncbi:MAG: serine hydrolase domain-containing protein, partial [Lachnospira sp.]|nr:serine hydrolase domain-containing protein [Lachnospira sp.]